MILDYVQEEVRKGEGFPSLSTIGQFFNFSRNTAKFHLHALERKGALLRDHKNTSPYHINQEEGPSQAQESAARESGQFALVARIAAGSPLEAVDQFDHLINFDHRFFSKGELKALLVDGNSMLGDAICDGDVAIIKMQKNINKNDVAAIRVNGEGITLKRMKRVQGTVELIPSNPEFTSQYFDADNVEVIGKLVGVVRKTGGL